MACSEQQGKIVVVELLSHVQLFWTQGTATCQASVSFTVSQSLLKVMSIESVMIYLILCGPLLLPSCLSQHQSLFQSVSSLNQVAKVLELQHPSLQ